MFYLKKYEIERALKTIKKLRFIINNKKDRNFEFGSNINESIEEIHDFLTINKKEEIKKYPNLEFVNNIKEFSYSTIKIINTLFYLIYEFNFAATEVGIENPHNYIEEYFEELINEIKKETSTDSIINKENEIEIYEVFEEINMKIEEDHIDGVGVLDQVADTLKTENIISDYSIFFMYEGYDEEFAKEAIGETEQFLINNIEQKGNNNEIAKDLLKELSENYYIGETANFFLKFNTKEEYERYSKIIEQNKMVEYNDIGLEVDEQLELFKENNIFTFKYTTHAADFSMCVNQSDLFAAFPMSSLQVNETLKNIDDEIKKNFSREKENQNGFSTNEHVR
ncbi:MAG: hypothetical protein B6I28_03340 [Fusobacteriia bacterium 4572_132]|nr:MAG: hypothetical protein B6I28_03340 [Fusobacteriia bacterium 4572_132]